LLKNAKEQHAEIDIFAFIMQSETSLLMVI